jgi:hypothetical protein
MLLDDGAFELCRGCRHPLFRKLGRVNGVATNEPAADMQVLDGQTFFICPRCWGKHEIVQQGNGLAISRFTPSSLLTSRLLRARR